MERPVYYYTWLRGRPNCHPVHTPKNIGDIEKLVKNHSTMLSWSMMGSGSISLPFLEEQIYQEIPPQFRYHGFVNEYEFNQLCLQQGIIPFAVIYESQSWEMPVELNEDETVIRKINYLPDDQGKNQFYGFTEFTNGKYDKLFKKTYKDYFPDGLVNSDGEIVTDLYEECTCRDMYGKPTHSHWVEVRGMPQLCRGTCRNNPVWRAYLKKNAEILVDAGVKAIQLDETETSITSIGYGGCFCKDCMKEFRAWLQREQAMGTLPEELAKMDLSQFDYGKYLRENGYTYTNDPRITPYYDLYWKCQVEIQNKYFREVVDYIRDYARKTKNEEILISANFTNMHLLYYPSIDLVDRCTTELRRTIFGRHNWLRLAAGFSGDLPLVIAESPYDAFIPNFVRLIQKGQADDYYRMFMMEAAVHGLSMAMPYGAWMGNDTYDSFYPPYEVGDEVSDFLYQNDALFSKKSGAKVLVLYAYGSYMEKDFDSGRGETLEYEDPEDLYSYKVKVSEEYALPFYEITQALVDHQIPFDVKILGDGGLAADTFSMEDLEGYEMVVLASDDYMTKDQLKTLKQFADAANKKNTSDESSDAANKIYISGAFAENEAELAKELTSKAGVCKVADVPELAEAIAADYEAIRDFSWQAAEPGTNVYVQRCRFADKDVYHILNYAYDRDHHRTQHQDVILKLHGKADKVELISMEKASLKYTAEKNPEDTEEVILRIQDVPCYAGIIIS